MKLLIVNQFFFPDKSATSQLMTDLAADLAENGIDVTVLSSRGGYLGESLPKADNYRNVKILRVPSSGFDKGSLWRRFRSYISFYYFTVCKLLTLKRFDIVVVLTTPPLIALPVAILCKLRGEKIVYLVQDLYPDIAIALEYLKSRSTTTRLAEIASRTTFYLADRVVAVGSCMKERIIEKGVTESKIQVITNWADSRALNPPSRENNPVLDRLGIRDSFVALYSGNMGSAHDIATFLKAAARLNEPRIKFLFIGGGVQRCVIEEFIAEYKLDNFILLPYVSREELPYTLGAADVCLVSQRAETKGLMVPSKLYGIMAASKPVLYVGPRETEAARTIEENDCGFTVSNEDSESVAKLLNTLIADRDRCVQMGKKGRAALESMFDRRTAASKYLSLFAELETPPSADCSINREQGQLENSVIR